MMGSGKRFGIRVRAASVVALFTVVGALLPGVIASPVSAATLDVSYTLQGCNLDHGATINTVTHVCSDNGYTTGNLGKSWAELDKVPLRVTLSNNAATTHSGSFAVAGDYVNGSGQPGWDRISDLILNSGSDSGCSAVATGATTITPSGQGVGGADRTIYRLVTASIPAHKDCIYDYNMRLALGSHGNNGSSLQANLWAEDLSSSNVGEKRVSIPVAEIAPQEFGKVMTAVTGSSVAWSILKSSDNSAVTFSNTCDASASRESAPINITISWTKTQTSSGVTTITIVYTLTNPAHLQAIASVSDLIYEGSTQATQIVPPANTYPLTFTLDPGETESQQAQFTTTSTATSFNDVATASYTIDGDPAGSKTATSSADLTSNPPSSGATATISDSESITPSSVGVGFRVTAVSGATGTFSPAYVPGANATVVTSLGWSSSQSDSGSVTFTKKVVLTQSGGFETSASLDDTATVTPDGQTATAFGPVSTSITVESLVSLTVSKKIPFELGTGETAAFTFNLYEDGADPLTDSPVGSTTITFNAGDGGATAKTGTISGLEPSTDYDLYEVVPAGWTDPGKIDVTSADAGDCSSTEDLTNSFGPATADASKVADPSSGTAGWVFTMKKGTTTIATGTSAADGSVSWDLASTLAVESDSTVSLSDEGSYSIVETQQTGWQLVDIVTTNATKDLANNQCTFEVNFPADFDKSFSCEFHNKSRGHVSVTKTVNGNPPTGTQAFTFTLREGADTTHDGTILETKVADAGNAGVINFSTDLIPGQHYQLCEDVMPGWNTSLSGSLFVPGSMLTPTLPNPNVNNMTVCTDFIADFGTTTPYTVDNSPPPGGRALTIGFWKNWASCSGSKGKQKPVLDQTLAIAALDSAGGLVVSAGNAGLGWPNFAAPYYLVLHSGDCQKAVNLLNKSTATGAKKKASDPVFNMTAQLIAAQLNYFAGAGSNAPTTSNITKAVVLINGKYHFDGDTYTPTKLSASDTTLATCLATQLDNYNNDRSVSTC